jgi:hypothetical protein
MNERMIPIGGVNPYANHPGFDAQGCELQYTVTQQNSWGTVTSAGFGCWFTGGHCLPGDHCEHRRARSAEEAKLREQFDVI